MELGLPAFEGILLLLIFGFLLLLAEVFVPGMILGLLGLSCITAGIVWSYAAYGPIIGTVILIASALLGGIGFILYLNILPKTFLGRQLINRAEVKGQAPEEKDPLLGKQGVALTILRPAGIAKIEGKRIDVVAEGGFIDAGSTITVVEVDGTRVVVRKTI
ncbi:MAG: hypothetical protein N2035_08390 [Chthoniobacterales bacterium]|nr:hypothetical protein [Chthoniobacterales bacterium]